MPLAGPWQFRRDDQNVGLQQKWYEKLPPAAKGVPAEIRLPGTTDEAKAGLPNTKKPTLDGLYRTNVYTGPCWYQRQIEIPAAWKGKRTTLFLERVRRVSQAWLDGRPVGQPQDSLIAPHVHELGIGIAPGRHTLTLRVDNTPKINLGVVRFRTLRRHAHRHERHRGADRVAGDGPGVDRGRTSLPGRSETGGRPHTNC